MPTPVSNSTPYVTAAQFLKRYDVRVVQDLCADSEHTPDLDELLADGTDDSNLYAAKLYAAFQDGSGLVEAAALMGGRYTPADLAALSGNQAALLQRIVSDLAMDHLAQHRCDPNYQVSVQTKQAQEFLNALAEGTRIFGIQEVIDVGHAELVIDTKQNVVDRNLPTLQAERFFGVRSNRRIL